MNTDFTRKQVSDLVEPLLDRLGMELVHLEFTAGRNGKLCLYIDKPGGVSLSDCEEASREISDLLDAYDPIPHSYILEVSSPGVERPISRESDFRRYCGEKIKIVTVEPVGKSKKFRGTLEDVRDGAIVIIIENGERVELPLEQVEKANLWFAP